VTQAPPNGTIFDRLSAHGVSWRDYYTDVPATAVIFPVVQKYPANHLPIAQFYADCAAGTLPAVSFVDSDIGVAPIIGGNVLGAVPAPFVNAAGDKVSTENQNEEAPANIALGENFVSNVVNAVLQSPAWPRILLVWLYDEHGGYYDHLPPPAAIPPDAIPPKLGPHDPPGGYDVYGPRVPAVIVSGHARPHSVSNVVYDRTSILATIEAKWNLPAMTYRDANAATLAHFLDTAHRRSLSRRHSRRRTTSATPRPTARSRSRASRCAHRLRSPPAAATGGTWSCASTAAAVARTASS
jgi:phospholipase C